MPDPQLCSVCGENRVGPDTPDLCNKCFLAAEAEEHFFGDVDPIADGFHRGHE